MNVVEVSQTKALQAVSGRLVVVVASRIKAPQIANAHLAVAALPSDNASRPPLLARSGAEPLLERLFGDFVAFRAELWGKAPSMLIPSTISWVTEVVREAVELVGGGFASLGPVLLIHPTGARVEADEILRRRAISGYPVETICPFKVGSLMRDSGCTLALQSVETWIPSARRLAHQLAAESGSWVDLYAYLTPPGQSSYRPHADPQDTVFVQLEGQKRWSVWAPKFENPHPSDFFRSRSAASTPPTGQPLVFDLDEGQALYVPSGWVHSATASEGGSVHATIGFVRPTIGDAVALSALRRIDDAVEFRQDLADLPASRRHEFIHTVAQEVDTLDMGLLAARRLNVLENDASALSHMMSAQLDEPRFSWW